jgi:hypothetical protein
MDDYESRMLTLEQVLAAVASAVRRRTPLSLVRFGHGELFVAAHRRWPEQFDPEIDFLKYAGVTSHGLAEELAVLGALRQADIVGLVQRPRPFETPLTKELLRREGLYLPRVCDAWVTHAMVRSPEFYRLFAGWRLAVVGRRANEGVPRLGQRGLSVATALGLEGFGGIPGVLEAIRNGPEFDVALVSAGVPATIICPKIAREMGKVAIDFGHALDLLIDGDAFDHERLVAEFNARRPERPPPGLRPAQSGRPPRKGGLLWRNVM